MRAVPIQVHEKKYSRPLGDRSSKKKCTEAKGETLKNREE
jgi:hypothetical protein